MDLDWQECHRLNVILLSIIGLWPYGNTIVLQLKRLVASFFAFGICFCQLATFFTVNYTLDLLLFNAAPIFVGCAVLLKYVSALAASDDVKKVTKTINDDFKELASKDEVRIIEKYIERGRFHTKGFAILICPAGLIVLLTPLSSTFLDIVWPLNECRNRSFVVMFELFFDQQKHFFFAACLYDGFLVITVLVFVATESLCIVYMQHACALFEVTSHRIRKLSSATATKGSKGSSNVTPIAQVVAIHSKALRHCKTLREDFMPLYMPLIIFGIAGLAAHLLRCIKALGNSEFLEFLISASCCLAVLGYMFYLNFVSQGVLNSSAAIFNDLYDTNWYAFPSSAQKLLHFFMLNTVEPASVSVCNFYHPSYESFSQIAKMAMSYATALYSLQ